jgi:hypothetical protein
VNSAAEPTSASAAACSELSARLHAEIERLHCHERTNPTDLGGPLLLALPNQSSYGTADEAVGAAPARRGGKEAEAYAVHCWAPNSTFTDPSCNCLGEAARSKLGSRRTIRIIIGSWYGSPSSLLGSRSMSLAWDSLLTNVPRLGAAADAFLLKIAIEGHLGRPVHLISDGLLTGIESALNLSGTASIYQALASGEADIYPEVRRPATLEQAFDRILGSRAEL